MVVILSSSKNDTLFINLSGIRGVGQIDSLAFSAHLEAIPYGVIKKLLSVFVECKKCKKMMKKLF